MGTRTPVLEVRNIRKHFGGVAALKGVGFELFEGEVLGIVGDNGAGKSTLIKIISGVYQMDEGEMYLFGKKADIRSPNDAMRRRVTSLPSSLGRKVPLSFVT